LIFWLIHYGEYDAALRRLKDHVNLNTFPWAMYYAATDQPEKIGKKFKDLPVIQVTLHPEKINHAFLREMKRTLRRQTFRL
jgi:hypothetical protein